jgi:hypothetical protein
MAVALMVAVWVALSVMPPAATASQREVSAKVSRVRLAVPAVPL